MAQKPLTLKQMGLRLTEVVRPSAGGNARGHKFPEIPGNQAPGGA